MTLTAKIKQWLIANCDVKANASDDEFRKAIGEAVANGTLSPEKMTELSTTKCKNSGWKFLNNPTAT